jgi:eukaryotic-like serine/threonine-protein kinase
VTTLGDYTLLAKLASGGMATVYVARKRGAAGFERLAAIKVCHPHLRDNDEFASMFLDEARLAASIHHPNVVPTLDVSDGELLYMVMEYIEGCTLSNLNKRVAKSGARIPPGVALRVMIDTLTGLHAAHELRDGEGNQLQLVHRDVSPQNILLGVDGVARITDFGIAFAAVRSTQTQEGHIKGKFAYVAPEQVKGKQVTRAIDIFSAGTVLWEALTGRALFRRPDDAGTINAILNEDAPAPSKIVPTLPAGLDAIVLKALQREPEERYATAADFAEALERVRVEDKTARAVAAYLEHIFGPILAERREQIRTAPELQLEYIQRDSIGSRSTSVPLRGLELEDSDALPPAGEIEHWRLRGILAAVMLLLVGSALGLLLARSAVDAQPPAASAKPGSGTKP